MTKERFMELLTKDLQTRYADQGWILKTSAFLKNNDTTRCGIVFHIPDEVAAPTVYVDDFYDDYLKKKITISEISEEIVKLLKKIRQKTRQYASLALDFESCRERIIYRLVSGQTNEQILEGMPYLPFLDFAVTFYIVCSSTEHGLESIRITNDLLRQWEVGVKELMACAEKNTPVLFPSRIEPLQDVLTNYLEGENRESNAENISDDESADMFGMLLLTNRQGINGASVLLYPGLLKELTERYGTDMYLIPSSIHEFLLLPSSEHMNLSELTDMIREINRNHVHPEEILSDHAYFYSKKEAKFYY